MKPEAVARLPPAVGGLQVNCCKNPACEHYAKPPDPGAEVRPPPRHGIGPTCFYDGRYLITSRRETTSGRKASPFLECLSCGEKIPLKSNQAIAEEHLRLRRQGAPEKAAPARGCPGSGCENQGISPELEPQRYRRYGVRAGRARLQCRNCGSVWTPSPGQRGRPQRPLTSEEVRVFEGLLSHIPYIRLSRLLRVGQSRLHQLLERFAGIARSAQHRLEEEAAPVLRGRSMMIGVDRQAYPVNWSEREDRRPVVLQGVAAADQRSGYVLLSHVNYDPDVEPAELLMKADRAGDYGRGSAYRATARLWLPFERAGAGVPSVLMGATVGESAEQRYRRAAGRSDVEEPETAGRAPAKGAAVHEEIALYAAFLALRERLSEVRRVTFCFEQESAMRAACLTAFADMVQEGRCEAFYIRIDKRFTAKKKHEIAAASGRILKRVMAEHGCDGLEARRLLVREALLKHQMEERGPWRDRWLRHPCPTAFEPAKEICRLTGRKEGEEEAENPSAVQGYAFASLHAVDRFFLNVRYKVNTLDRHRPTATVGPSWNVYHSYNPGRVPALLAIYRLWYNWCLPGEDLSTPAMRLGLAARPLDMEDVLEKGLEGVSEAVREPDPVLAAGQEEGQEEEEECSPG